MKVLNLYAGIGGNRKLWNDVEVTAVENDESTALVYQMNYEHDNVIIGDAKEYLLDHFKEFDFIWASPPCPTHSRIRTLWSGEGKLDNKTSGESYKLPDMTLYSIIIFLKHFYKGNWVVENVISYYDPLIKPYIVSNHYIWSNNIIGAYKKNSRNILSQDLNEKVLNNTIDTTLSHRKRRTMLNNALDPKVGLHIFNEATKIKQMTL